MFILTNWTTDDYFNAKIWAGIIFGCIIGLIILIIAIWILVVWIKELIDKHRKDKKNE